MTTLIFAALDWETLGMVSFIWSMTVGGLAALVPICIAIKLRRNRKGLKWWTTVAIVAVLSGFLNCCLTCGISADYEDLFWIPLIVLVIAIFVSGFIVSGLETE
jgi:hypothetical protein